ncbi:hypothetical protein E4U21_007745 [Claviceps maximensis]|nr:hypothetical protein E4U21_007745 [Claviceps maximensis]
MFPPSPRSASSHLADLLCPAPATSAELSLSTEARMFVARRDEVFESRTGLLETEIRLHQGRHSIERVERV